MIFIYPKYINRRANGIYIPKSCYLQLTDSLSLFQCNSIIVARLKIIRKEEEKNLNLHDELDELDERVKSHSILTFFLRTLMFWMGALSRLWFEESCLSLVIG